MKEVALVKNIEGGVANNLLYNWSNFDTSDEHA